MWQLPLTKLNVGVCKKLDVNATMGMIVQSFPGLTELELSGLEMRTLPEGIGNCAALQTLILYGCKQLQSLPEGLKVLKARGCKIYR